MKFRVLLPAMAGCSLMAGLAQAHIRMLAPSPMSRWIEDKKGDPQKEGVCGGEGDEADIAKATKVRTKLAPGAKVMLVWTETIYHPGFFRVSFDDDGTDAFKDPASVKDVVMTPALPILVDGIGMGHKTANGAGAMHPAAGPYMVEVTLPNVTCKTCTLQVIQFMSDSASTYHHCMDLELAGDGPAPADAGAPEGMDAGAPMNTGGTQGSGGASGGGGASGEGGSTGSGGAPAADGGSTGSGGRPTSAKGGAPGKASGGTSGGEDEPRDPSPGSGCSIGGGNPGWVTAAAGLALVAAAFRRRRRR